jgi:calpain-15
VRLWVDGEYREVSVDDQFPYDPYLENWAFSRNKNFEIWVLILEKAYAKVFGSYHRIEMGGRPGEALPLLTGAPTINYKHKKYYWKQDMLWNIIENADKNGYIMTSVTSTVDDAEEAENYGI